MRRWFHSVKRATESTRTGAIGPRKIVVRAMFAILTASTLAGCDSLSFVPPPPAELRDGSTTVPVTATDSTRPATTLDTGPVATKSIDVVLGPHGGDESEVWKAAVRSQAGLDKTRVRIFGPAEPPSTQVDLVREALTHHPRVLLIESTNAVDLPLARSIEDARSQGISVVIAGRLPAREKPAATAAGESKTKSVAPEPVELDKAHSAGKAPVVVVAPKPFDVSATQLVAAVLRVCKAADVEPGNSAILLFNTAGDPLVSSCALAIKNALKAAEIAVSDELWFSANDAQSVKAVEASLKSHPQTILVFTVDSVTSGVIKEVIRNDADHRLVVAGCYAGEEMSADLSKVIKIAAVATFTPTRMLRKAVTVAASLAHGQDVPADVEFPINIAESLATPAMLKAQALQWKPATGVPEKAKK